MLTARLALLSALFASSSPLSPLRTTERGTTGKAGPQLSAPSASRPSGPWEPQATRPRGSPLGPDTILVSTAWVAEHLRDPSLVLLQVGPKKVYDAGHIPGARYLDYEALMAPHQMDSMVNPPVGDALMTQLPSVAHLDSLLSRLGVTSDSRVVVYFGKDWVTPTTRAFLTLDYAGLRGRVFFLDVGLPTWRAEGRPVTTKAPVVAAGSFHAVPRNDVVVDRFYVKDHLDSEDVTIVDARDRVFYDDTEDNEMPRGGHIAGAASIPYTSLTDTSSLLLKDKAELARIFAAAGVVPGTTVVGYCHIGQQASLVYFVARYLGYAARLYDGSFQEWSAYPELPVEGANRSAGAAH